jgi:hypothetical protein
MQTYYGMAVNNDTKTMAISNTRLNWFGRGSPGAHTMNRKISKKKKKTTILFNKFQRLRAHNDGPVQPFQTIFVPAI